MIWSYCRPAILVLMHRMGIFRFFRYLHRNEIVILAMHGVMDERDNPDWTPLRPRLSRGKLDEYLRMVSRRYNFVSLGDAVEMLEGRMPLRPYSVVLTFDDGYRNNLTHALPILRRYHAPATFFVPTGFVSNPRPFWFDRLDYALQQAPVHGREVRIGVVTMRLDAGSREALRDSYKRLRRAAKKQQMSDSEFLRDIEQLAGQLERESGRALADIQNHDDWSAIATWEQIKAAGDDGITIGSHTADHVRLGLVDTEAARDQLARSREDIGIRTGFSCTGMACPNGSHTAETIRIARECGYEWGVLSDEGLNGRGHDVMKLRRISVPSDGSPIELLACMCQASQGIRLFWWRREEKGATVSRDRVANTDMASGPSGGAGVTSAVAFVSNLAKSLVRRCFPHRYEAHALRKWRSRNPCTDADSGVRRVRGGVCLGIIAEFAHKHRSYIDACRELGIAHRVVDISGPQWVEVVKECDCDAFLVRPSCELSVWKQMFDERLRVIVEDFGKIIYPSYDELWFYESKRRMGYWMQAHDVPHPRTWVFYNCEDALAFARTAALPVVGKSDFGAGASGVRIFRSRLRLMHWVRRCFSRGILRREGDPRDRQWGVAILQEYLSNAKEWRMIRIGDSYFGRQKLRKGDFHSGTRLYGWYDPPRELLDLTRSITEKGGFTSMCLDIFEREDGVYYVNELQSLFGASQPHQMRVNGIPGRYLYDSAGDLWRFEEGEFNRNNSCNLRVQALLDLLEKQSSGMLRPQDAKV